MRGLVLSLLLLSSAVRVLRPGTPQEPQGQPALQHQISVTLKLIQVFVSDKRGQPVTDLEKGDFEVLDNGMSQTVTDFERHVLRVARDKSVGTEPMALIRPEAASRGQVPKLNRKLFFIFDVEKSDLQGFAQSKTAALHFMDTQVQPTDEIGVLSYHAKKGLVIHEYMSRDHKRVRRAIETFKGVPGTGSGGPPTEPGEEEGSGTLAHLAPPLNPEADELAGMRSNFVSIMTDLAKTLRYLPGYKNVILFSAGFSRSALIGDMILRKDYEDMAKEFSASSSPIYSVNTLGTRSNILSPDERGEDALKDLSTLSGGQYFRDVAQEDKVAVGIQNATSNYYVLGYSIDEKWDGEFHDIKVKVRRDGCVVMTQHGYYNPKPFSRFSSFEKQLHLMDLGLNESPQFQSPTELPLTSLPGLGESGPYLVLMTELVWDGLKDAPETPIEAHTLVFDQDNKAIYDQGGRLKIPDLSTKRVDYYDIIPLKSGAYRGVLVFRNMKTGQAARARGEFIIPQPPASGLQLDPPLLLIPAADRETIYLGPQDRGQGRSAGPPISLKDLFPFLTDGLVPVMGGLAPGTAKLFAIVRATAKNLPGADLHIDASLKRGAGGEAIPLLPSILKTSRRENTDILFLELRFPELPPDDYTLALVARDKNSGATAEASRRIKLD